MAPVAERSEVSAVQADRPGFGRRAKSKPTVKTGSASLFDFVVGGTGLGPWEQRGYARMWVMR